MSGIGDVIKLLHLVTLICACQGNKQPHILLIVADDLGWNDIGYHGSEIKTPNLDSLASNGVKLENYYASEMCTPSRNQLLSGKHPIHTGLQHDVIKPLQPRCMPVDIPTLPGELKKLGYSTHMVGKWHLGMYMEECWAVNRGFDTFLGMNHASGDYYFHTDSGGYDLFEDLTPATNYKGIYSTHLFAERASELIHNHATENPNKPLMMYVAFQACHGPLMVPDEYTKLYPFVKNADRKLFAGMVTAMDEAIGNITEAFKENKMWDDTLLIFTPDNGGSVNHGGNNLPLQGSKFTLWEGGVRVAGFVHGKMLHRTGVVNKELVHISDWFPTILNLAGGDTEALELDGYDVWNVISDGGESKRKEILFNIDPLHKPRGNCMFADTFDTRIRAAIRKDQWKLITGNPGFVAVSKDKHKYKTKNIWLYDLENDPYEQHDVSHENNHIVRSLLDRLAHYNSTAVPAIFPKNDGHGYPNLHGGVWLPWKKT